MAKDKRGFLEGALIGAVIGAVAGVLLAPKSGRETREDIKRKTHEISDATRRKLNSAKDELNDQIKRLKAVASDLKGDLKRESQALLREAENLQADLKDALQALRG